MVVGSLHSKQDRTHLAQCINLYGHMITSLTVGHQNDILLNFLPSADI